MDKRTLMRFRGVLFVNRQVTLKSLPDARQVKIEVGIEIMYQLELPFRPEGILSGNFKKHRPEGKYHEPQ
jgi:hypothetical protein